MNPINWLPFWMQCLLGQHCKIVTGSSLSLDRHRQLHYIHLQCENCKRNWVEPSAYCKLPEKRTALKLRRAPVPE